jgi:hypothetical protein
MAVARKRWKICVIASGRTVIEFESQPHLLLLLRSPSHQSPIRVSGRFQDPPTVF